MSGIPHKRISDIFGATKSFFNGDPETTSYLHNEAIDFGKEAAKVIPGYQSSFGTGYPFYAIDSKGRPVQIDEISNFLSDVETNIDADKSTNPHGWPCPACQKANNLPDVKTSCKPCNLVKLKPREVFRSLPDLDIWVVTDLPGTESEEILQSNATKNGYIQSDINMRLSLAKTALALHQIRSNSSIKEKVPLDVHLVATPIIIRCLDMVANGADDVQIDTRSLHAKWEDTTFNFLFDLILSLTMVHDQTGIITEALHNTRIKLKNSHSEQSLMKIIAENSTRGVKILQTKAARIALKDRISQW